MFTLFVLAFFTSLFVCKASPLEIFTVLYFNFFLSIYGASALSEQTEIQGKWEKIF